MPNIGLPELLIIVVIALVFFGPGKLPEMGSAVGKAIRGFKKSMSDPDTKTEKEPEKTGKP
ncbi:MAG: twin-arginine translocase TatA/TatE family subunit [Syntrophaceae bacterium]